MASKKVGSLWAYLGLKTTGLSKGIQNAQTQFKKFGNDLQKSGNALTKGLTLPLVAGGLASAKFAIDFNRNMANVGALLGGVTNQSTARLKELKSEIQDLAVSSGKSTEELAQGMYSVISAFGDTSDASQQLTVATKLAIGGVGSTEQAIKAISASTKAYGDTSATAQLKVANLMIKTIQDGETNLEKLGPAVAKVTALSADLGITQEELFAVFSTGTGALGEASEVATQLKGSITSLIKPSGDLTKVYEALGGTTGKQLVAQYGFVGALNAIKNKATELGLPMANIIGSVEGLGFANAFTGGLADDFTRKLENQKNATGALDQSYQQQIAGINGIGHAWEVGKQVIVTSLQKIGDAIFDAFGKEIKTAFTEFASLVKTGVDAFQGLDSATQKNIIKIAGLTAILGPVVVVIGGLITLLGGLGGALITAGVVIGTVTGAFKLLENITLEQVIQSVQDFKAGVIERFDAVKAYIQAFQEGWGAVWDGILVAYEEWKSDFLASITGLKEAFISNIQPLLDIIHEIGMAWIGFKDMLGENPDVSQLKNDLSAVGVGMRETLEEAGEPFGDMIVRAEELKSEFKRVRAETALFGQELASIGNQRSIGKLKKELQEVNREIRTGGSSSEIGSRDQDLIKKKQELTSRIKDLSKETALAKIETDKKTEADNRAVIAGGNASGSTEKLTDKIKDLSKELSTLQNSKAISGLEKQIDDAIKAGNTAELQNLTTSFEEATRAGISAGYTDAITAGGESARIAGEIIEVETKERVTAINTKIKDALEEAHRKSVEGWSTFFENAITGVTFDLKDMFKQVAVGFAAEIASGIAGSVDFDFANPKALGSKLGQILTDKIDLSGIFGGAEEATEGLGGLAKGTDLATSSFSSLIPAMGAFAGVLGGTALTFKGLKDLFAGKENNSAEGIAGRAQVAILSGGLSEVARGVKLFGRQSTNPETLARLDIEKKLEATMKELGGIIIENNGQLKKVFDLNANPFNSFKDFDADRDFFSKFPDGGSGAFLGVGNTIASESGNPNLKGGQVAAILAESLSQDLDGLKQIAEGYGLTLESIEQANFDSALNSEQSWLEYVSIMRDVNMAWTDGLTAVGAYTEATDKLLSSNGRGKGALTSAKNIAIEAKEAGITTLEAYRAQLLESGEFTQGEIEAIFEAFSRSGITSLDQIIESTDKDLANFVANLDASLQDSGLGWRVMGDGIKEVGKELDNLPKSKEIEVIYKGVLSGEHITGMDNVTLPVGVNSVKIPAFAKGGYVDRPTLAMVGERGSEFIIPENKLKGQVGDMQPRNITIQVDASGDSNLEARLLHALTDLHSQAVSDSVDRVIDLRERGII